MKKSGIDDPINYYFEKEHVKKMFSMFIKIKGDNTS